MKKSLKQSSISAWYPDGVKPNLEQLNFGVLQRIADATEAMAKNHNDLIAQNQWLKETRARYRDECEGLKRQLAATKGAKTKLRNELNRLKAAGGGIDGQANPATQGPASRQG